ncbi:MAG: FKBP-type peptidyl-prolyl cis-trans isomerase [Planctomycetota bacterium]|jgi:FKBP-type peptidyl-prolyl cis-trans isomerase 2
MLIKKGVKLLEETEGNGESVQRQRYYVLSIRFTLNRGEVLSSLKVPASFYLDNNRKLHNDGYFEHCTRIDRHCLIPGLFYAVQGMKVGGYRKVSISPHLAYGEKGIPGVIPANAKIIAEIKVLRKVEKG